MNWIHSSSSFKYSGKPVTRRKAKCQTPLGLFYVFEAVSGNCFIEHPFIAGGHISNIPGFGSFDNGTAEWFGNPKIKVKSIEEGIEQCEKKWDQVKAAINKI